MYLQLAKPSPGERSLVLPVHRTLPKRFSGRSRASLLPPEESVYRDLEFKGLFGWDFCF